jgi:hypothetical protein
MNVVTTGLNVHRGSGRVSRMTWIQFKNMLENHRGLTYDENEKEFYFLNDGKRRTIPLISLQMIAMLYGFYEDLEEYIV